MRKEALILVDLQKDFWEKGGALYVNEWEIIIPVINNIINEIKSKSGVIIASRDWHPENHVSFSIWPKHCVNNTHWAKYMDWLNIQKIDYEVLKWFEVEKDSYSSFGWYEFEWNKPKRNLLTILKENNIKLLKIVWLATDYCVKATVLDALNNKFEVEVITAWIRAVNVNPDDWEKALEEMKSSWAKLVY